MDVWRLLGAAVRRWYVFVAVAALAVLATMLAGSRVQPEFTSTSSLLLTPPAQVAPGNPYKDLATAAQAVGIVLQGSSARGTMGRQGLSTDYDVKTGTRTPIMEIVVRASSASLAARTGGALIAMGRAELQGRQQRAGLSATFQVSMQVLEGPNDVAVDNGQQKKVQVIVLGLGASVAFLLAVVFDDILLLLAQRRLRRDGAPRAPKAFRWPLSALRRIRATDRTAQPHDQASVDRTSEPDAQVGTSSGALCGRPR